MKSMLIMFLGALTANAQNFVLNSFGNAGASFFYAPAGAMPQQIGVIGQAVSASGAGTLVISNLMFAKDLQAPRITFDPATVALRIGSEGALNFSATDNDQIASSKVFYKPIGSSGSFASADPSTLPNSAFTRPIATSWFDQMGMEYYIEVKDKENTTRHPSGAGKHVAFSIHPTPQIPTNLLSYGRTKSNYRIISIPFLTTNPITQIFKELGPSDKKKYRIYKYENNEFQEYPAFTTVSQGDGYFIIMSDVLSNVVLSMPEFQAPPNHQSALFDLALTPGWNLIGNPYTLEINWDEVRQFNNNPASVASDLKIWTADGNYANIKNLAAYQGAFVFVNGTQPVSLKVPFKGQPLGNSGGRIDPEKSAIWRVNLTVSSEEEQNSQAAFGMHEKALLSYDAFDDLSPPALQDFLTLKFLHPEHSQKFFTRDFISFAEKYEWDLEIPATNAHQRVLSWSVSESANVSDNLYLYDVDQNVVVDMKINSTYAFPNSANHFKILYGKHDHQEIYPGQVTVVPPFPNPVRSGDLVVFSIGIPKSDAPYPMQLQVFDTTGKNIFETRTTLTTGLHKIALPSVLALETRTGNLLYYKIAIGKSTYTGKIIYNP